MVPVVPVIFWWAGATIEKQIGVDEVRKRDGDCIDSSLPGRGLAGSRCSLG